MSTIQEHFGLAHHSNIPTGSRDFYCGMELEIEEVEHKAEKTLYPLFQIKPDHSLRNHGLEYISVPLSYEKACEAFYLCHKSIKVGDHPFSERTSIHIHVNMGNLELKEVKELVLLYALLEPLFFKFVGEERQNNIFCVPLYYTSLPSSYKKDIQGLHGLWHKYTAFNIQPLGANKDGPGLGTIEFRHLYGTADLTVFALWLKIIKELYDFVATTQDFSLLEILRKGQMPKQIAMEVVPSLVESLGDAEDINMLCKDSLLDVKLASGGFIK